MAVDESSKEKKASYSKFIDIYTQYQRQAKRPPEELRDLLEKGIALYKDDEFKILTKAYVLIKQQSCSIPFIQTYILSKCIDKLKSYNCPITAESIDKDFDELMHNEETEADSIRAFIREIVKKNNNLEINKLGKSDVLSLLYLFLAISIEATIRLDTKQKAMFIEMERTFVEEAISLPGKDLKSLTCSVIPEYLAKGKMDKSFSSMCYLYYDFKLESQELQKKVSKQLGEITQLKETIDKKDAVLSSSKERIESLIEVNRQLNDAVQTANNEKEEAEDRLEYETNRIELQYRSQNQGLAKKYKDILGLEIDGIEDIVPFLPDDARDAVQERVDRMRKIIAEIGGE